MVSVNYLTLPNLSRLMVTIIWSSESSEYDGGTARSVDLITVDGGCNNIGGG